MPTLFCIALWSLWLGILLVFLRKASRDDAGFAAWFRQWTLPVRVLVASVVATIVVYGGRPLPATSSSFDEHRASDPRVCASGRRPHGEGGYRRKISIVGTRMPPGWTSGR